MEFVLGIFSLFIASIGARGTPKIEIFEIREGKNGLELNNLNSNPTNHQRSDSLLKLLREPKTDHQATKFAKQLLSKLKSLRGEEKVTLFGDDAHIYILNSDVLNDDSTYEDLTKTYFVDKTRNDRNNYDTKDIKEVLLQLLQPNRKLQPVKLRKLRQSLKPIKYPAVLRTNNVVEAEVRTMTAPRKRIEYEYDGEGSKEPVSK